MKGQEILPRPAIKDGSETDTAVLIICPVRKENIKLRVMTLCRFRQIYKFCFLECISNSTPITRLAQMSNSQSAYKKDTTNSLRISAGIELLLQTEREI